MTGKLKVEISDDQDCISACAWWKIPIHKATEKALTDGQINALIEYCYRFLKSDLDGAGVTRAITLNPCTVYRSGPDNSIYYDAETGALYSENDLLYGDHEIRLNAVDPERPQNPEENE